MYNITHLFVCSADLSLWEPAQLHIRLHFEYLKECFSFFILSSGSRFLCLAGFSSIIYMFDLIY